MVGICLITIVRFIRIVGISIFLLIIIHSIVRKIARRSMRQLILNWIEFGLYIMICILLLKIYLLRLNMISWFVGWIMVELFDLNIFESLILAIINIK